MPSHLFLRVVSAYSIWKASRNISTLPNKCYNQKTHVCIAVSHVHVMTQWYETEASVLAVHGPKNITKRIKTDINVFTRFQTAGLNKHDGCENELINYSKMFTCHPAISCYLLFYYYCYPTSLLNILIKTLVNSLHALPLGETKSKQGCAQAFRTACVHVKNKASKTITGCIANTKKSNLSNSKNTINNYT